MTLAAALSLRPSSDWSRNSSAASPYKRPEIRPSVLCVQSLRFFENWVKLSPMDALLHSYAIGQHDTFSGDITRSFYEALILFSILRPSSGHSKVHRSSWHVFLDDLSWLCDTQSGGKTVVSIGTEQTSQGLRFWISANGRVKPRSLAQLENTLSELRKLDGEPEPVAQAVEARIFDAAVYSSHERVKEYLKKLRMCIEKLPVRRPHVEEG